MPKDRKLLLRLKGIDGLLNRRRRIKRKILANFFDVTEKTIQRNIQLMKDEYGAPISFDNNGYFYTEHFSLPFFVDLTDDEIRQLKLAVMTLNQFQHLEAFKDLIGVIEKIESSVKFKIPNPDREILFFESVPFYEGTELIEIFISAIELNQVVEFEYQSFKSERIVHHCFHPYVLKEHSNRWYVIGWLPSVESVTPFALERIIQNGKFQVLDTQFNPNLEFDINNYFKNTFGMTVYQKESVEEIILSFTPLQAKYFKSKPFHEYEIINENDKGLLIKMNLIPNYELIRKLAGMGNGVKVIKPQSLEKKLTDYLSSALKQYQ